MTSVRPSIRVLTEEQKHEVHQYSLEILARVGVQVDSERARAILERGGCRQDRDGRFRLPADLVAWALAAAPSSVQVYDRQGEPLFNLGADQPRFGVGVTALYYQEPLTDRVVPFGRRHMEMMVRLGSALPSFDVISTVGIIQDVAPEEADLYALLEMIANTVKPLVILVSDDARFCSVLELAEHLHGGLAQRPFLLPYVNPITPLVLNRGTVDKMLTTIERGIPFIYSNYGMVGATTPITPAGTLALLNAELLAGLALTQLARQGTPIILGNLPAFFDMRGMGTLYDPISYLLNLACAEMMAHYGLPHAGTSGSGMGWGADVIAAGHQWFNHLTSCLGQIGLAPFVGDNLGSKVFSPAVMVFANEVIAQARRMMTGFELDPALVGVDEIEEVGPGGSFLTSKTTLKGFRDASFESTIFPALTLEKWEALGAPRADQYLRRHTQELLQRVTPPEDHEDLVARGLRWIEFQTAR